MKRRRRWPWAIGAVVLVLVVLAAAALTLLRPERLQAIALSEARRTTGMAIDAGPASVRLAFSGVGLRVRDLRVAVADSSQLLVVERADATLKFRPLLRRQVELRALALHRPDLQVRPPAPDTLAARRPASSPFLAFLAVESWSVEDGSYGQNGPEGDLALTGVDLSGGFSWRAGQGATGSIRGRDRRWIVECAGALLGAAAARRGDRLSSLRGGRLAHPAACRVLERRAQARALRVVSAGGTGLDRKPHRSLRTLHVERRAGLPSRGGVGEADRRGRIGALRHPGAADRTHRRGEDHRLGPAALLRDRRLRRPATGDLSVVSAGGGAAFTHRGHLALRGVDLGGALAEWFPIGRRLEGNGRADLAWTGRAAPGLDLAARDRSPWHVRGGERRRARRERARRRSPRRFRSTGRRARAGRSGD